jgi:hypothetical protein
MTLHDFELALQKRLTGLTGQGLAIQMHANEVDALALTLIGEGAGEAIDSRVAIGLTVLNRSLQKGQTVAQRCFQHLQYSCWWPQGGDKNNHRLLDLAAKVVAGEVLTGLDRALMAECRYLAGGIISRAFIDTTKGSTHYLTTALYHKDPPAWTLHQTPVARIGAHVFFAGIAWS